MPTADRIPVDDMLSLMESGDATPLLGEFDIGPTWYAGVWWHVPRGELDTGFVQADDASKDEYYRMFVQLAGSAATLAEQFTNDDPELADLELNEPDPNAVAVDPVWTEDRGPDDSAGGGRR